MKKRTKSEIKIEPGVARTWSRSETIALAADSCAQCHGLGLVDPCEGRGLPCNCVLRTIFRACYDKFWHCAHQARYVSRISQHVGADRIGSFSRKDEEYLADFSLVSRRALSNAEYQVFKYHFLLGADWKLCCRKLKAYDRGSFFHAVYGITQKLGRIFAELKPYPLYPLSDYFYGESRYAGASTPTPLRPPLKPNDGEPLALAATAAV